MAGIDWFRWHHGSVTDPKFGLVARKAGASVAEVIAVWASLLEAASAAEDRGNAGTPDFETLDFALGLDDGAAQRIYERMCERNLIDAATGRLIAWEKRQPKREREDDTAAERKRRQRDKERGIAPAEVTPEEDEDSHVPPCHATSRQKTPREEESREEIDDDDGAGASGAVDNFDDPETPKTVEAWSRFFDAEHGVKADPQLAKFRKLAAPWVNAKVTLGQMRRAIAKARADATEPIAYLPAYADQVLATLSAPPKPPATAAPPRQAQPVTVKSDAAEKTQELLAKQALTPEQRAREAERAAEIRRQRGLGREAKASQGAASAP